MANCNLDLYFPGWVVIIKVKANLSSTGTGLPTGTELGKSLFKLNTSNLRLVLVVAKTQFEFAKWGKCQAN